MSHLTISKNLWVPDSAAKSCFYCNNNFTAFRRRHHCRICGAVFCSNCCSIIEVMTEVKEKLRICISCRKLNLDSKILDRRRFYEHQIYTPQFGTVNNSSNNYSGNSASSDFKNVQENHRKWAIQKYLLGGSSSLDKIELSALYNLSKMVGYDPNKEKEFYETLGQSLRKKLVNRCSVADQILCMAKKYRPNDVHIKTVISNHHNTDKNKIQFTTFENSILLGQTSISIIKPANNNIKRPYRAIFIKSALQPKSYLTKTTNHQQDTQENYNLMLCAKILINEGVKLVVCLSQNNEGIHFDLKKRLENEDIAIICAKNERQFNRLVKLCHCLEPLNDLENLLDEEYLKHKKSTSKYNDSPFFGRFQAFDFIQIGVKNFMKIELDSDPQLPSNSNFFTTIVINHCHFHLLKFVKVLLRDSLILAHNHQLCLKLPWKYNDLDESMDNKVPAFIDQHYFCGLTSFSLINEKNFTEAEINLNYQNLSFSDFSSILQQNFLHLDCFGNLTGNITKKQDSKNECKQMIDPSTSNLRKFGISKIQKTNKTVQTKSSSPIFCNNDKNNNYRQINTDLIPKTLLFHPTTISKSVFRRSDQKQICASSNLNLVPYKELSNFKEEAIKIKDDVEQPIINNLSLLDFLLKNTCNINLETFEKITRFCRSFYKVDIYVDGNEGLESDSESLSMGMFFFTSNCVIYLIYSKLLKILGEINFSFLDKNWVSGSSKNNFIKIQTFKFMCNHIFLISILLRASCLSHLVHLAHSSAPSSFAYK